MKNDSVYVSQYAAQRVVGNVLSIESLVRRQLVPRNEHGLVHLEFLRRLAHFTQGNTPTHIRPFVCLLEWLSANQPEMTDYVSEVVGGLLADGKAITSQDAAQILGYHAKTIRVWANRGFLPGAHIAYRKRSGAAWSVRPSWVFIPADVRRIREIIYRLTIFEAAERLGVTPRTIERIVKKGHLQAIETPVGLRIAEENISFYLAASAKHGLDYPEALKLFGTSPEEFRAWVESTHIIAIGSGRYHTYDEESVRRAKATREQLHGGFEWLPADIGGPTYTPKTAAKKLGLRSRQTPINWGREGLLPHFDLGAPQKERREQLFYVAPYIDALVLFAQPFGRTVSKDTTRAFKEYMRQQYT